LQPVPGETLRNLMEKGDDMEPHAEGTEVKSREFILSQIATLCRKKYPLSGPEKDLLVDLVKKLDISRGWSG
jgi:hypothetical protein